MQSKVPSALFDTSQNPSDLVDLGLSLQELSSIDHCWSGLNKDPKALCDLRGDERGAGTHEHGTKEDIEDTLQAPQPSFDASLLQTTIGHRPVICQQLAFMKIQDTVSCWAINGHRRQRAVMDLPR